MKKFLLTLLCLVAAVGGSFAESYTIEFKDNTSDSSSALNNSNYKEQVTNGADKITSFSCFSTYYGKTGLKVGKSSGGNFTLTLSDLGKVNATSIVVKAKKWKSAEATTIKVGETSAQSLTDDLADYTFNVTGDITEIKITSSARSYVKSITVNYQPADGRKDAALKFDGNSNLFEILVEEAFTAPNLTKETPEAVKYESSKPDVASVNATTGDVEITGVGSATITATTPENDTYRAGKASYTISVIKPYTVAEALEAANANGVYVKGYVVNYDGEISNSGQLKYNIADTKDGSQLYIYYGSYIDGAKFTEETKPEIGAFVIIKGNLTVYGGKKEINSGNKIIRITRPAKPELSFAEAEYSTPLSADFESPELSKKTNGAITWTSSKESVATVDADGKVTLLSVGTTIIKAAAEEVFGQFKAGEASYTLTVFSDALGTPECEEAVEGAISTYEGATLTFTAANAEKLTVNGTELTDGVYTVAFPENQNSYVLTVTAVRGEETQSADFTISRIIPGTVAFSAENGSTVMAGSTITLSCENADRIMWSYTEDGIFEEYTEEGITVDETNSTIFAYGEYKGFRGEIASAAYTMKEVEIYTLVTDVNELKVGGKYIIAIKTANTAMGGVEEAKGESRDAVEVSFYDNDVVYTENVSSFRLVKADGGWKLRFDNGNYLMQNSNTGDKIKEGESGYIYTITIDEDNNAKISPKVNPAIWIQYNKGTASTTARYKTYKSTSGMQAVQLYHLAETFEAPAEDAEVIYMHGVFADRAWDFAAPVALSLTNDGTYMASNIHIGSIPAVDGESLEYVFSTTMAEGGVPHVAGRRSIPAETNWADLGEGTVYHAGGVTKASAENAASEIVPYTVAKAGLYNITADFNNAWPAITLSESISTGVDNISVADGEAEYYNLQGIRVSEPKAGVYIRRQGNSVSKVVLR